MEGLYQLRSGAICKATNATIRPGRKQHWPSDGDGGVESARMMAICRRAKFEHSYVYLASNVEMSKLKVP